MRNPTSIPSRRKPTTIFTKSISKEYERPVYTKPKIINTALERNPDENYYNNEDFDEDEDQIQFDTIPMPKTTTRIAPTERSTETTTSFTTPKTKFPTQNPATEFSSKGFRDQGRDEKKPDLISTSSIDSAYTDRTSTNTPIIKSIPKKGFAKGI